MQASINDSDTLRLLIYGFKAGWNNYCSACVIGKIQELEMSIDFVKS